jgi:predicted permease
MIPPLVRSNPGTALVAVATLAMGIGFTTTMYGIVHGATRSLPVDEPDRIVAVSKVAHDATIDAGTRPFDYEAWASASRAFAALAAFETRSANLADEGEPERVSGAAVTDTAFRLLGVAPLLGRGIRPSDTRPEAEPIVVLSDRLWQRRFGGDPAVVGRRIRLTGVPHTVTGVMPRGFGFPVNASFWVPLRWSPSSAPGTGARLQVFGRLADGYSIESSRAEIEAIARSRASELPSSQRAFGVEVVPFVEIETPREVIRALYLLVFAVSFVLLIACTNVANLLLARAVSRARDVAVRVALGATRRRIVAEHLVETAVLSLIASLAGLGLAHAGTRLFAAGTSHIIEAYWVDFRVDGIVVLFASVLSAAAALASGLWPALRASRTDVVESLKDGAPGSSGARVGRLSRGLLAFQIALACGLLALTMILGRSAVELRARPWPFDPERIATAELSVTEAHVADPQARRRFLLRLADELRQLPGAAAAGVASALPGRGAGSWTIGLDAPAGSQAGLRTGVTFVTPEYFDVLDARPLAGRLLTWEDDAGRPAAAVVNRSFVARHSADRSPLGRQISIGDRALTIVGIVPDLMPQDVQDVRQDAVYASMLQFRPFTVRIMARGPERALTLVPALRAAVARVDRDLPVQEIFTLHEAVYRDKRVLEVLSSLFLVFGVGALALTAIGLYGVVSFAVTRRTREIGIRRALGASRADVVRLVVGQSGRQLAVGLAAGLLLAAALSRGFAAAVEQIAPADGPLLALIAVSLSLTVMAAVLGPVRRALRLEITRALRVE